LLKIDKGQLETSFYLGYLPNNHIKTEIIFDLLTGDNGREQQIQRQKRWRLEEFCGLYDSSYKTFAKLAHLWH
jgi:hypothetical protein